MKKYHVVVGLEMHCEMKSNSKVFSTASNIYNANSNTNVRPICIGLPGILPNLNFECVKKAIMAAMILNCKIPDMMLFDRKNYYYPDLPKGYQITQNTSPVGVHGNIDVLGNNGLFKVTIQDIHLEEDAAQLDHLTTVSLINYNRAGVPLLECVTDPCIYSADDAVSFIETMCRIYQYTDISDADVRRGQIRCDVNVNLQDEDGNFITPKVEIKNVNSVSNVHDAIEYEFKRQSLAYENGKVDELVQETRRFDEETGTTIHMRSKVDAIDYKYFVEPNIPPFIITDELKAEIKNKIPMLALERKEMYMNKYKLEEYDANILIKDRHIADYFEKCVSVGIDAKTAANWVNGVITAYLYKNEISIDDFYLKPELLKQIIDKMEDKTISSKQAKDIFNKALEDKKEPISYISDDIKQVSDEGLLESIIDKLINDNPSLVSDYQNGRTNIFDFFVGQTMKETKGKANPNITKELLHQKLDK